MRQGGMEHLTTALRPAEEVVGFTVGSTVVEKCALYADSLILFCMTLGHHSTRLYIFWTAMQLCQVSGSTEVMFNSANRYERQRSGGSIFTSPVGRLHLISGHKYFAYCYRFPQTDFFYPCWPLLNKN